MSLTLGWHTKQLDYVQAFPQAPPETQLYTRLPAGIHHDGCVSSASHMMKVLRNVYGSKQAGRTFNKYLVAKLTSIGFSQSRIDPCVFYKGGMMYVLYTDDSILAGPDLREIEECIEEMKGVNLDITVEGDLSDFLGVNIDRLPDGSYHLSQPKLIDSILEDLRLSGDNVVTKATPMSSSKLLSRHPESASHDNSFHYRRAIGKLNFLEKSTRPDIAYAVHQCARFSVDPKVEHASAVRWIGRYLKGTRDKGFIIKPDSTGLEVFVDADFSGNWDPEVAHMDKDTARSRHGYFVMFAGCPIVWASQLQTEIALSSTESELTGLSYALRSAIPMMRLITELKRHGFDVPNVGPKVHCKVFEDNSGALEIARLPKVRPRTKHLNVRLHHFRDYVERGEITIHPISTDDQLADMLTKPVPRSILDRHRILIMGW
jgi:hypothetical protein